MIYWKSGVKKIITHKIINIFKNNTHVIICIHHRMLTMNEQCLHSKWLLLTKLTI